MKNCNLFRFLGAHYIAISDDGEMNPPSVVAASQASLLSSWESLRCSPRKLEHQPNIDDALLSVKSSALKLDAVAQVMWKSLWLFTLDSEQEMLQVFLCSHPEDMFTFVFLLQPWYIRKEQECKTTAKSYLTLKKKKKGIRRMRGSSRKRKWEVTSKEGIHPYLVGKAAAATSSPLPLLLSHSRQQVHRHDVKLRPPFYI